MNTPIVEGGDMSFKQLALQLLQQTPLIGKNGGAQRLTNRCANTHLIDGHNDFPYIVRGWHLSDLNSSEFDLQNMPAAHTDLTRLRKGRVGTQVWSAYVPRSVPMFWFELVQLTQN